MNLEKSALVEKPKAGETFIGNLLIIFFRRTKSEENNSAIIIRKTSLQISIVKILNSPANGTSADGFAAELEILKIPLYEIEPGETILFAANNW